MRKEGKMKPDRAAGDGSAEVEAAATLARPQPVRVQESEGNSLVDVPIARLLEEHRGERHLVVLHNYPDPDAIASAYAHRLISAAFDIEVDTVYMGNVSHQQNIALTRVLDLDLIAYDPQEIDFDTYDGAVFVDNQGTTVEPIVSALEAAQVPILAVIDHHERQDRLHAEFEDIRATGATATIYVDYLADGVIELDTAHRDHVVMATGLMHGVLSDTRHFVRASAGDFRAAAFLARFRDAELLEQIMSQARSKQAMDVIQRALGNRVVVESFSIAGIGFLRGKDRDAIPQAADFLLSEENVHTAIVYGIVRPDDQNETLIGSLRTAKFTLAPDAFIKDVFGKSIQGQYFGGGKPGAGGFSIPLGFLSGEHSERYQALKWQLYEAQIKYKIFAKIGIEQEPMDLQGTGSR